LSVGEEKVIKLWDLSGDVSVLGAKGAAWSGDEKARLGRLLFFDSRMSGDDSFSCALCHKPEKAFTDGKALSMGFTETLYFRNTPTLLNAADQKQLYWDGRFADGDMLSLMRDHLSEAHFMNVDGRLVEQRLRQAPDYVKAFRSAYGGEPTYGNVLDALSTFVSSLKSGESAYDRYKNGEKDALSKAAERGRVLFEGKGGCAACHAGPDFTNGKLHNRKVPENPEIFTMPLRHITFRRFFRLLGVRGYADLREDLGYSAISGFPQDRGKFRTPSLRNVSRTAPYMHNGMIKTLERAVKHEGPKLSRRNRADLVEFLKALSAPVPEIVEPDLPRFEKFIRTKSASALRAPEPQQKEKKGTAEVAPLAALPAVPIPPDNLQSPEKIELGKLLYFDPRISGNGHTSCVACHVPEVGWGDALDLSREYTSTMHFRHTQTVLNTAYLSKLNWDGVASSLEAQAEDAITKAIVGNGDPVMIEERLAQIPEYVRRFKEVFGVERPIFDGVLKAIASFIRAEAVSKRVPFDDYLNGDAMALSESEKRGLRLFEGKAGCIRCHNGALASDQGFHNTGVPQEAIYDENPLVAVTIRFIHASRGVSEEVYRGADSDPGLYLETKSETDIRRFRTPSLRELKYTEPYMHNGVFKSLKEVVDFYDKGGGDSPGKSTLLKPLALSESEKEDLIAFLKTLSSREVISIERPPIEQMVYAPSAVMIERGRGGRPGAAP
jgi:cytochrome c peroxidase